MATVANRRSVISLYSDPLDPYSHQVRIVLAEKGVAADVINVDFNNKSEDLYDLNPYGTLPTLIDRDLILYESRIILEYLDERFPHPPLMPVYPVARAETRRMIFRIEQDWYSKMKIILHNKESEANQARKEIVDTLLNIAPVFANKLYFLSDEFSLLDCWLAPLLWRLNSLKIELPSSAKSIQDYAQRLFMRESFRASLTDPERELRAFV
jgi:RNA polymerase-associated protein